MLRVLGFFCIAILAACCGALTGWVFRPAESDVARGGDVLAPESLADDNVSTVSMASDSPAIVFPTGYVRKGRFINVQMSDGTVLTERDNLQDPGSFSRAERNFIVRDGKRDHFRPAPRPAPVMGFPGSAPGAAPVVAAGPAVVAVSAQSAVPSLPSPSSPWVLGSDGVYRLDSLDDEVPGRNTYKIP